MWEPLHNGHLVDQIDTLIQLTRVMYGVTGRRDKQSGRKNKTRSGRLVNCENGIGIELSGQRVEYECSECIQQAQHYVLILS